jgi:hypothetical protein
VHQRPLSPEAQQLLKTRSFGVEDIYRWFDAPPVLDFHNNARDQSNNNATLLAPAPPANTSGFLFTLLSDFKISITPLSQEWGSENCRAIQFNRSNVIEVPLL